MKISVLFHGSLRLPFIRGDGQVEGLKVNAGYGWFQEEITEFNCLSNHALK